jgi:hypothetical protein
MAIAEEHSAEPKQQDGGDAPNKEGRGEKAHILARVAPGQNSVVATRRAPKAAADTVIAALRVAHQRHASRACDRRGVNRPGERRRMPVVRSIRWEWQRHSHRPYTSRNDQLPKSLGPLTRRGDRSTELRTRRIQSTRCVRSRSEHTGVPVKNRRQHRNTTSFAVLSFPQVCLRRLSRPPNRVHGRPSRRLRSQAWRAAPGRRQGRSHHSR